jgi:RNA polymerase sigma factor (sigma-70 family)
MPASHAIRTSFDRRPSLLGRPWLDAPRRSTFQAMAATDTTGLADDVLIAEEARLAHAAAGGDGTAFATLYERYERRAYNLSYRITDSEDDAADAVQEAFLNVMRRLPRLQGRDLAFGSYLFTATRNASYDLMQKRRRAEPSDSIPESAAPVGAGVGGLGLDPGDPDDDPDRKLLLESQQEEIREANLRLPERQREALALRELEELSYDEIAAIMEMNRNSVAQLISRARIKLRDELRGTALASIAASSPDCERALPLIAMRDDGQLEEGSGDATWLDSHMAGCDTCRLGLEAMQEAGASYRAWAPIAAAPWLFEETMAKAAELMGADWSEAIATKAGRDPAVGGLPGMPSAYGVPAAAAESGKRRRRLFLAATLAAALLGVGVVTAVGDDDPPPVEPAAETTTEPPTATDKAEKPEPKKKRKKAKEESGTPEPESANGVTSTPAPIDTSGGSPSGGSTPTQPEPQQSEPGSDPPADPPSDPVEPPVVDEPPVVEEPPPAPDPPPRGGGTGPNGPPIL